MEYGIWNLQSEVWKNRTRDLVQDSQNYQTFNDKCINLLKVKTAEAIGRILLKTKTKLIF